MLLLLQNMEKLSPPGPTALLSLCVKEDICSFGSFANCRLCIFKKLNLKICNCILMKRKTYLPLPHLAQNANRKPSSFLKRLLWSNIWYKIWDLRWALHIPLFLVLGKFSVIQVSCYSNCILAEKEFPHLRFTWSKKLDCFETSISLDFKKLSSTTST